MTRKPRLGEIVVVVDEKSGAKSPPGIIFSVDPTIVVKIADGMKEISFDEKTLRGETIFGYTANLNT